MSVTPGDANAVARIEMEHRVYRAQQDGAAALALRAHRYGWVGWLLLVGLFSLYYAAYFSPVLVHGGTLAPGDGEVYYLSYFDLPVFQFWNDSILSGFPVIADIQAQTLYPLRWLSPSYNVLVLSAYVVAAVGTFGLALTQTGSRVAALFSAFVVSGSAFMMGHLGHLGIVHSAAWVPAILWSLASLSRTLSWRAVACGALSVAMCLLGGHPQISIVGLLFAGTYAVLELGLSATGYGRAHALRLLVRVFLLFLIGLLMASPTLVGTLQSAAGGMRGNWSVGEFNSFSHTWSSLRLALLPHLYGAHPAGPYGAYGGPFNITELAIYAGLLPWMLACFALPHCVRQPRVAFWLVSAVVSFLLCVGTLTPLGELVYELPLLGRFRAQARFGYLGILCLTMLSAQGLSAMLANGLSPRARGVSVLALLLMLGTAAWWLVRGLPHPLSAELSLALKVSALTAALSLAGVALIAWRGSRTIALALVALVALDLASFGWFYEWRYASPKLAPLPADSAELVGTLKQGGGRLLPIGAERWGPNALRPNINMRYGVPSVVGYGPLLSSRYAGATGADTVGGFPRVPIDAPLLDVLGVRWLAGDLQDVQPVLMGAGCGLDTGLNRVRATLPPGVPVRAVRVVSHMSCSQSTPTGHPIATVEFSSAGAPSLRKVIAAGDGTAEWAWDRPDVRASVAHLRSHVADTFEAEGTRGLWFDAVLDVPDAPSRGENIIVSLMADNAVPFKVRSIEYEDDGGEWHPVPLGPEVGDDAALLGAPIRAEGLPVVRERRGYAGAAWSVCSIRAVPLSEMADFLRSRNKLNARRTALVEQPLKLESACRQPPAVTVQERHDGYWRVRSVGQDGASLLVVSEAYAAGWRAWIDGAEAPLVPLYGIVMGVKVPKGAHEIELRYRPGWLSVTLVLAGLSLLTAILLMFWGLYRSGARPQNTKE